MTLASETEKPEAKTITHINPLYADVLTEEDLNKPTGAETRASVAYYTSTASAAAYLRECMTKRSGTISVGYKTKNYSDSASSDLCYEFFDSAVEHTGVPNEGDYLLWHYGGWQCSIDVEVTGSTYYLIYTYTMTYYTTSRQESAVATAADALLKELGVDSMTTDYEKVKAVYDWLCDNVTYDYDNLYDESYTLKHAAYAAMIDRTAVCQAYASLMYYLTLKMGIDCRVIAGLGNGGPHGWNIVELDGKYYNVDATWDTNYKDSDNYQYFLRTDSSFTGHSRYEEYTTAAFYRAYPMGTSDYELPCADGHTPATDPAVAATCTKTGLTAGSHCSICGEVLVEQKVIAATGHIYEAVVKEPTCTTQGYTGHGCVACGDSYVDSYTDALGHSYGKWTVTKAATCTQSGTKRRDCTVCVSYQTRTLAATGHSYTAKVSAPACTEKGYTTHTCSTCGDSYADNYTVALGHDWDDGTVTVESTKTQSGLKVFTCQTCGGTKEQVLPDLSHVHSYTKIVSAPTCTGKGYTIYICSCGDSYVDNYRDVLDHTYVKGVCSECGDTITYVEAPVVKAVNLSASGKIKLSWNEVDGAAAYKVYWSVRKNSGYTRLTTTESTSVTNSKAEAGKTYYYYVIAVAKDGTVSEKSGIVARACDLAQPTVTLSNVASTGKVKISWKAVAGAVKYEVYRSTDGKNYSHLITTSKTQIINSSAKAGKKYYYQVRALSSNTAAHSAWSSPKSRVCDLAQPVLSVTRSSSGKPRLSWNAVSGATKYKIYYAVGSSGTFTLLTTTSKTAITHTKAVDGKTYRYRIVAVNSNSAADSAKSETVRIVCTG